MTAVCWLNLNPETSNGGHWDQTLLADLFAAGGMQEKQCACGEHLPRYGAVVVLAGQHNVEHAEQIGKLIEQMDWALTIVTSDEEALFPLDALPHDGSRFAIWNQYRLGPHREKTIPIGYPPGLREWAQRQKSMTGRVFDPQGRYFFAGQDTHARRHDLIRQLHRLEGATFLATDGFAQGLDQHGYWRRMLDAEVLPAPAGPFSVDSFRLYEALELGRIPVVETHSAREDQSEFWGELFGYDHLLPYVDEWSEMSALSLRWPQDAVELQAWWTGQKRALARDLASTVRRLAG